MTSTESTATITALVKDLRRLALDLEKDLTTRARDDDEIAVRLRGEYDAARSAERTAAGYPEWLGGRVTQAAAAWVLSTVFVRYCEDNGLIDRRFLAGPLDQVADAEEAQGAFTAANPTLNNRDWLEAAFRHLADAHPTVAGLFDPAHNPLWDITISYEAANDLIGFWRRRDDSGTAIRYDLTGWDTRFLGDLYQDLSEAARKTYALLQTPEFVEEFILDLTLDPAIEEFGLAGLRTIDPACGSGHFLLGLFRRILAAWRKKEPGTDDWELIRRSMASVHGCDKNPFAVSVARFRLLVAALDAAEVNRLDRAGEFPIDVAVGDSLAHGRDMIGEQGDLLDEGRPHTYSTEDVFDYVQSCDLLDKGSYHVVVANPPYITVKDERENRLYRSNYDACAGTFALSVPFAQRLFRLAVRTDGAEGSRGSGIVGQITANSFMKREFGKKLIENYLPKVQLTAVVDTSGAYIPGHGTPTVILVGRNHYGRTSAPIRTVLGIRGEPSQPADPAHGLVWTAITGQLDEPGTESEWVSVADLEPERFRTHPWTLSGGGADGLLADVERATRPLAEAIVKPVGRSIRAGADEAFMRPIRWMAPTGCVVKPLMIGEVVRDWSADPEDAIYYPYGPGLDTAALERELWTHRALMAARRTFHGDMADAGLAWFEYMQHTPSAYRTPLSITFAEIATHNHFVLDRGGKVFNRTAPVIKLPAEASEDDHLGLIGVLNSSTACFWLKQVCFPKGGDPVGNSGARVSAEAWMDRYAFNGSNVQDIPHPADLPLDLGRRLDSLAQGLAAQESSAVCDRAVPTRSILDLARAEHSRIRQRMIALQEELDWEVYRSYDLLTDAEATAVQSPDPEPLALGERAFEIVLARKVAAGEAETAWFDRHRSSPVTELPAHWSPEYRAVVEARIALMGSRRDLALIERPECKRRWASDTWEKKEAAALRTWLLDRVEDRALWFEMRDGVEQPRTMTVSRLADRFPPDSHVHAVAALYAADHLDRRDMTLAQVLAQVVADEHVPYLAALRYQDSGLDKRAEWERTWEGQREEDRTGKDLHLAVPPKYKPADFRKNSYWTHRGKLDVPKERFVSYPGASPDADDTLLLGWAGWDHKDQAQALVNLVNDRTTQAGWDTAKVVPLLAGLAELMPWVHQWHGEYDPEWDGTPAEEYQTFLDQQRADRELTEQTLRDWRPAAPTRGRRPRSRT
ncbi:BREX-2 system adenine-specific DNA-methyltransferase PglX [Pseudonocardia alni]|uniref:BREX-2 system adenine-specific DNA-methyltransferase PglX n=1 Tax=Pseudonocardia alni TaxID=33907 RepID=UPI00279D451A|nr:BREX-2 system adenine-specific DNA-methyltransferase PglX [Pseudonocardia alni]